MYINLLLLSNMGPSKQNPNSGRFVYNQYNALKNIKDINVDFFYLNQDKKTGLLKKLRYPLFFITFILRYVFTRKKLDIIHIHFYFPLILFAILYKVIRNNKLKIVVTCHGSDIYLYDPPSRLYQWASYRVDQFIFVSQALCDEFYRQVDAKILSAGVLDAFYNKPSVKNKEFDLLFVGHLDFNKGIDRLALVLEKITIPLKIAIVGVGDVKPYITNKNAQLIYLGAKTPVELIDIYQSAKFLINFSRKESFGLVMTEAMACGLPVIATLTDGAKTQINHNVNGFVFENSDELLVSQGSNKLETILSLSTDEYQLLANNAIESAQQFKLSNVIKELVIIYNQQFSSVN